RRALEGLAALFSWTLPSNDDFEPWDRLLRLGWTDAAGIDVLLQRARSHVLENDRGAIQASIAALSRRIEYAGDDTERFIFHLDVARLRQRAGLVREASESCKRALGSDATSLTAATLLAELAAELGDDESAILASKTLAAIVTSVNARADFLRDAADLS